MRRQGGFSYVEVLVASVLIAISLVPAMEALRTGILATGAHRSQVSRHGGIAGKMEEVRAQRFALLEEAEVAAGGGASSYSDAPATPDRRVVLLSRYDGDNADADDDPFTGTDDDLLWVRIEIEGTALGVESLVSR